MVAKDHRIVITLNADNYKAVQERVGTDNHEEVTELVKSAVISLANGAPEPTRKARQKIERMAKREAELAVKRAKLSEGISADTNPLVSKGVNKERGNSDVEGVNKATVTATPPRPANVTSHAKPNATSQK